MWSQMTVVTNDCIHGIWQAREEDCPTLLETHPGFRILQSFPTREKRLLSFGACGEKHNNPALMMKRPERPRFTYFTPDRYSYRDQGCFRADLFSKPTFYPPI
jgi:hypothetical protein